MHRVAWGAWAMAAVAGVIGGAAMAGPMEPPGTRYEIKPSELPPIARSESAFNAPLVVPRGPGDGLLVPEGFSVEIFADGLDFPRWMAVAPNGDVFLAEPNEGRITVLRDVDGDGRAELRRQYARGFDRPHGLAFQSGALFVGDLKAIWRFDYKDGDLEGGARVPVTRPGAIGQPGNHWTRNIAFAPDGASFFVAIGSRGNVADEPLPHASVQRFSLDGSAQMTFASGLRNPVGIAFNPGTEDLYVVVNERDTYGNGLVPDYLTRIREGEFFGWPFAYIGPNPDPEFGTANPALAAKTVVPDLLFKAHSAPIGLVFYTSTHFPESYRGDAFVALHGSWNAAEPAGYIVAHVPFADGRPEGWYETFASGFWARGETRAEVWGRPAGLVVSKDGSLLVADDTADIVWRISYSGQD